MQQTWAFFNLVQSDYLMNGFCCIIFSMSWLWLLGFVEARRQCASGNAILFEPRYRSAEIPSFFGLQSYRV